MNIVFPRTHPDLDGVACAIAYAELLRRCSESALAWIPEQPDSEANFALRRCRTAEFVTRLEGPGRNLFVYVDASGLEGLPSEVNPLQIVEVIDHRFHGRPETDFPNAKICIEPVGAAATIIVERFRDAALVPSPDSGRLLYGAIHSNTQQLRGSITSERDHRAVRWLEESVEIPPGFIDDQLSARRNDILSDLESYMVRESKLYDHPSGAYMVSQLEFVGAMDVAAREHGLLVLALQRMGTRAMLNLVDAGTGESRLIVPNEALRCAVENAVGISPQGTDFHFAPGWLRKQLVAALEK